MDEFYPSEGIPRRDIPKVVRKMTGGAVNPHEQTIRRWYTRGVRGVVLRVDRCGGRIFTRRVWIERFFEEVRAGRSDCRHRDGRQTIHSPTPAQRSRAMADLNAKMEAMGL